MFNNTALDVFIGLVFIFLLYSLLATIVQEMIAVRLSFRAKVLEKAIIRMLEDGETKSRSPFLDRIYDGLFHMLGFRNLLNDKKIASWFYAHPLIKKLGEDNYYSKPAYLNAQNFSKVIVDLLHGAAKNGAANMVQAVNDSIVNGTIYKLPVNIGTDKANPSIKALVAQGQIANAVASDTVTINNDTALYLRSLWIEAGADIDKFRTQLENWFDATMERATGWYKRYTQLILFIVGLSIAIGFNVDTIAIHRILAKDKNAREQLVTMAINSRPKIDKANQDMKTDSLLDDTYKMVAEDASAANNILGLGRPWKDSCKICSQNYTTKKDSFEVIADQVNTLKLHIKGLEEEIKVAAKDSSDTTVLKKSITQAKDRLNKYNETMVQDSIRILEILKLRCPVIKEGLSHWFKYSPNQRGGVETMLGWLLTALAISLGAPFWFDLLNKLIKLRGTGTKITADSNAAAGKSNAVKPATVNVNVNSNPGGEAVG